MRVEKPTMEKMKINQKSFTYVIILSVNNENTLSTHAPISSTSAKPEVRGTADVGWRSLFPLPFNPPRTHPRLYHHMCLRTDGQ